MELEPKSISVIETRFYRQAFKEWYMKYAVSEEPMRNASAMMYASEVIERAENLAKEEKVNG